MISLYGALAIQANLTEVGAFPQDGKYGFNVYLPELRGRLLLSSSPAYSSSEIALDEGRRVVDEVKRLDLDKHKDKLVDILSGRK